MMNTEQNTENNSRQAALNGLAIVGFIALVGAGMWVAVYSARFVPDAVSRLGAAAVSLTSFFTPAPEPSLSVVVGATTTIPFGNGTSTSATSTPATPTVAPKPSPASVTPTPGSPSTSTTPISGSTLPPPTLYGLPDFAVTITAVGYLTTTAAESFVPSHTVPRGARPAVKFTIRNVGTNATGLWRFSAEIPTKRSYTYHSDRQQNLNPSESIDYTLGFDQEDSGTNQRITVIANYDNALQDANTSNNTASVTIEIL